MAKYQVTYGCGHTGTVDLIGPTKQRENRLEWLATQLCPDCWKEKQAKEAPSRPIFASVSLFDTDVDEKVYVVIELGGETYSRKEDLKKLGFSWGATPVGPTCWHKLIPFEDYIKNSAIVDDIIRELKEIAPVSVSTSVSKKEVDFYLKRLQQKEELRKKIAEIPKPKKPEFLNGRWNGKIYAKNTIYVDGEAIHLTSEQLQTLKQFLKDKEEYAAAVKAVAPSPSAEMLLRQTYYR